MNKESFVKQQLAKRGIGASWNYGATADSPEPEYSEEAEVFCYADEDSEETIEAVTEPNGKKSPRRAELESEFLRLYRAYMRPEKPLSHYGEQFLLEDLFELLRKLNKNWTASKAMRYRETFPGVDEEIALQIGCIHAYEKLMEDKQRGVFIEHAVAHYLRVAQNRAIDLYFRKEFGRLPKRKPEADTYPEETIRRKVPKTISIESIQTNIDGTSHVDRDIRFSYDPFTDIQWSHREREDKSHRLATVYLQKLMDYPFEPQKPLAVMYGSCLFQLAKVSESEDPLSLAAKASTALSSTEWAFRKMGLSNLKALADISEKAVRQYYGTQLAWGSHFTGHMLQRSDDGLSYLWADIVYTQTYTRAQTSNWMESVSKSSIIKAAKAIMEHPELKEFVLETLSTTNRFRRVLEDISKEANG